MGSGVVDLVDYHTMLTFPQYSSIASEGNDFSKNTFQIITIISNLRTFLLLGHGQPITHLTLTLRVVEDQGNRCSE